MSDFEIIEEYPSIPFVGKDADGKVVFRDAITFPNVAALRNASAAERKLLREERYESYLALLSEAAFHASETLPEEILEGQPTDGA